MNNEERRVLSNALNSWGPDLQIVVTFEEMAELQKELSKYIRGKHNVARIAEEIADVEIMLSQMKLLFNIEEGVDKHREFKLKRLMKRVECQSKINNKYKTHKEA